MESLKEKCKTFSVLILTPYLSENLMEMPGIQEQIDRYKYDSGNFKNLEYIMTDKQSKVHLMSPPYKSISRRKFFDKTPCFLKRPALVIAGCTEPGEDEVESFKGSGLVVARYSIFYGGRSEYTGNYPEQTGYSLDIPKEVKAVKALLRSQSIMNALDDRDLNCLRENLNELNETLKRPILTTPYLEEIFN